MRGSRAPDLPDPGRGAPFQVRMEAGRFKVFKYLNDWFDEFRLYHRKDGKVHKEGDDLMSATRYAVMMLRYARTAAEHDRFNRRIVYPQHKCCMNARP
jgi:hypothetical protein